MYIVLDTQPIYQDFYLSHAANKRLLDGASSRGWIVCMPEVVIEEMVADYRDALEKALQTNRKGLDLASLRNDAPPSSGTDVDAEITSYRKKLNDLIKRHRIRKLEMPHVTGAQLFERNRLRRRPFKPDGKGTGLNDALTWASVLELYEESDRPIALITGDRDYAEPGCSPRCSTQIFRAT